jgi:hypothetical protein
MRTTARTWATRCAQAAKACMGATTPEEFDRALTAYLRAKGVMPDEPEPEPAGAGALPPVQK